MSSPMRKRGKSNSQSSDGRKKRKEGTRRSGRTNRFDGSYNAAELKKEEEEIDDEDGHLIIKMGASLAQRCILKN